MGVKISIDPGYEIVAGMINDTRIEIIGPLCLPISPRNSVGLPFLFLFLCN